MRQVYRLKARVESSPCVIHIITTLTYTAVIAQNAIPIPGCSEDAGQAYCSVPVREQGIAWDLDQRENFGQVRACVSLSSLSSSSSSGAERCLSQCS